jgi:heme-degrading monooxygenase HmoA
MAYFYQVSFNIGTEAVGQLQIGASLERVLGYLKALLPSEPGFIEARALYSVDGTDSVHVITLSEWENWEDVQRHQESALAEDKAIEEFGPHIARDDLIVRIYNEIS